MCFIKKGDIELYLNRYENIFKKFYGIFIKYECRIMLGNANCNNKLIFLFSKKAMNMKNKDDTLYN